MNKITMLALSFSTAAFLVGCGGGSSSSTTSSTTVPATKGPLLMATAKDSSIPAKTGTQIAGTNKYTFEGTITYPIIVEDGYVDVNNNGVIEAGIDYEFDGKLTSYSNVVTPITTYLGNPEDPNYETKLDVLKTLTNSSDDDLTKNDPSETNENVIALVTSLYQNYPELMDNDDTNNDIEDDIEVENSSLKIMFDDYKQVLTSEEFEGETLEEKLVRVEEHLRDNSTVTLVTELDIKKINFNKEVLVGYKFVISPSQMILFTNDNIILADSSTEEYSQIMTYGDFENGTATVALEDNSYFKVQITEEGFDVSLLDSSDFTIFGPVSILNSELTEYTEEELAIAIADVPFVLTNEMISGKQLVLREHVESIVFGDTIVANFYEDGSYFEEFTDEANNDNTGECTGTWEIVSNQLAITSTCTDDDSNQSSTTYLTFSQALDIHTQISYVDGTESGTVEIFNISDAVKVDSETTSTSGSLTSVVSGKSIIAYDAYGYAQVSFYADGTYKEVAPEEDSQGNPTGTVYTCTGKWLDFGNNNVGATCDGTSTPTGTPNSTTGEITYTFNSSGVEVYSLFSENQTGVVSIEEMDETFDAMIGHISDLTVTPFTIGSSVYGKVIEASDEYGSVTATFNTDGTYSESGTDVDTGPWTCTGKWLDFGNDKIGTTCDAKGTTPDGIVDNEEVIFTFNSNKTMAYVIDSEELFPITIDSISDISQVLPK